MTSSTPIVAIDSESSRTVRLTAEEIDIVALALSDEWQTQAKAVDEDVEKSFGSPDCREMHLTDAAWKVRRQGTIVGLLEQLGWVKS